MGKILHEDDLKRGMFIKTSRFHNRALVVLDRPVDGLVRLLDVTTQRVICATAWGMGIRTRRIGAGNPRYSTYSLPRPLCLSELKAGKHIEVRDQHGKRLYHGLVKAVTDDPQPMVLLHDEAHHRDMTTFAADMGLVPYASGNWSGCQRTYVFGTPRLNDILQPNQAIPRQLVTV